jgi:O-antigen/teichoic acid export membrane protein
VQWSIKELPLKKILTESIPLMLTGSVFFILGWTDNIMIGIFRTEAEVGIYDIAFKISSLAAIVLLSINAIQAPVFAELYAKGEMQKLQRHIFKSTRILFYTSFPVTLACIFIPEYLLGIFGDEFKTATLTLSVLAIGNFINSITGSIGILLQMTRRQKRYNQIILVAASITIILNIILIPRYGILGAAIASSTAKILQNVISVAYAKLELGILSFYIPGIEKISSLSTKKHLK